jgi:hypothetical protein
LSISGDFNVNTKDGVENLRVTDTTLVSVTAGTVAVPAINFGLTGTDTDTGIYRVGANQMGFSAAGTLEAQVATTTHLSVVGGTVTNPAINFGITGTDTNTGMYRVAADTIGFATGGVQKVGVYSGAIAPYIEGLNVGTILNIAGIQRLSATAANSWEDGHMGNSSALIFVPSDFHNNALAARTASYCVQDSTIARVVCGVTDSASGVETIIATKLIPKGFIVPLDVNAFVYSTVVGGTGLDGGTIAITSTQINNTVPGGMNVAGATLAFGVTTRAGVLVAAATPASDGLRYIAVKITTGSLGLTPSAGILGVSIPIERA